MLEKTEGIILSCLPYAENSVIARVFTRNFGLQSYLINGVRSGKGNVRPAHLLPLNLVELVVYHKKTPGLQRLKELKCTPLLLQMRQNPVKSAISVFMNELLTQVLQLEEAEADLFRFAQASVHWLEMEVESLTLFPHFFMVHLSKYLGIFPRGEYTEKTPFFDLESGAFVSESERSANFMLPVNARLMFQLMVTKAGSLHETKSDLAERNGLLEDLIRFYSVHHLIRKTLQAPGVLHEILR